ncbi:hypothetical protein D3C87_347170 [compost metagenome]
MKIFWTCYLALAAAILSLPVQAAEQTDEVEQLTEQPTQEELEMLELPDEDIEQQSEPAQS